MRSGRRSRRAGPCSRACARGGVGPIRAGCPCVRILAGTRPQRRAHRAWQRVASCGGPRDRRRRDARARERARMQCRYGRRGESRARCRGFARLAPDLGPGNAAMLDPAAFSGLGGLETIDDRVAHVHLKDVTASGELTEVGAGVVDFAALLRHLAGVRYDGYLSFETHYQRDGSGELATRDCVAALRSIAARPTWSSPREVALRRDRSRCGRAPSFAGDRRSRRCRAPRDQRSRPGARGGACARGEVSVVRRSPRATRSGARCRRRLHAASVPPAARDRGPRGGTHVLVEKPLAVEAREADTMIEAADRAERLLGVCFQQRFRPVIAAARELIASRRLGELVRVSIVDPLYRPNAYYGTAGWRGTWTGEGGGVLMNQAPHTLDLLCHSRGRRPRSGGCRGAARSRWRPKTRRPRWSSTTTAPSAPSRCRPSSRAATHRAGWRPRPDRDRGRVAHLRALRTTTVRAPSGGDRDVRATGNRERARPAARRPRRPPRCTPGFRGSDPHRQRAARARARRTLVARARECDRALDAHRSGGAAAGRPRGIRGSARDLRSGRATTP